MELYVKEEEIVQPSKEIEKKKKKKKNTTNTLDAKQNDSIVIDGKRKKKKKKSKEANKSENDMMMMMMTNSASSAVKKKVYVQRQKFKNSRETNAISSLVFCIPHNGWWWLSEEGNNNNNNMRIPLSSSSDLHERILACLWKEKTKIKKPSNDVQIKAHISELPIFCYRSLLPWSLERGGLTRKDITVGVIGH